MNEGIFSLFYRLSERIMNVAYLNLLWLFFTFVGLGIFGVFPATAAVFAMIRQEMINDVTPTFVLFFKYFKKDFWRINFIGWILVCVGYVMYLDFTWITYLEGNMEKIMYFSLVIIACIFIFLFINLFPVYVHYDVTIKRVYFISLMTIFVHPIQSILIGVVSYLHLYVIYNVPGLIPFFGLSVWAFCISHICQSTFSKIVS